MSHHKMPVFYLGVQLFLLESLLRVNEAELNARFGPKGAPREAWLGWAYLTKKMPCTATTCQNYAHRK